MGAKRKKGGGKKGGRKRYGQPSSHPIFPSGPTREVSIYTCRERGRKRPGRRRGEGMIRKDEGATAGDRL